MNKYIIKPIIPSSTLKFFVVLFLSIFSFSFATPVNPVNIVNASNIQSMSLDVNVYIEESRIGTSFFINTRSHNYKGDYVPLPNNDVTNN